MKLLLTSGGLTNKSIANALFELVGKKSENTSVTFIPTAANIEVGDKDWMINDLINLKKQNFHSIDIVDISALDKKFWLPRIEAADVIFFEGGDTYHLMKWIYLSGLKDLLPKLLEKAVYAGVSAGSMVTNPDLALKLNQVVYDSDLDKTEDMAALNYVDFYFLPHLNSAFFPKLRKENIIAAAQGITKKIYALDDQSALKVVDGKVEVVSEGEWLETN